MYMFVKVTPVNRGATQVAIHGYWRFTRGRVSKYPAGYVREFKASR